VRERLSAWLDGEGLTGQERRIVAEHLEGCAECREVLAALERTSAQARALPPIEAPWTVQTRARTLGRAHAATMKHGAEASFSGAMAAASAPAPPPALAASPRRRPDDEAPRGRSRSARSGPWIALAIVVLVALLIAAYVLLG
jgi:anti-sigma factor RsiW